MFTIDACLKGFPLADWSIRGPGICSRTVPLGKGVINAMDWRTRSISMDGLERSHLWLLRSGSSCGTAFRDAKVGWL